MSSECVDIFILFKLNTLHKEILLSNFESAWKPWCNDTGVLNSPHHHQYTTIVQGGCFITTQYHVVQISQSENQNFCSVWKLNNKTDKREKSPYKKRMNEIVSFSGKCSAVSMEKSNTKIWYQMGWLKIK